MGRSPPKRVWSSHWFVGRICARARDAGALEASEAAECQQGNGANPDQEHRERAEIAIAPKRTFLCVHNAPLSNEPPFAGRSPVKALNSLVALGVELVQTVSANRSVPHTRPGDRRQRETSKMRWTCPSCRSRGLLYLRRIDGTFRAITTPLQPPTFLYRSLSMAVVISRRVSRGESKDDRHIRAPKVSGTGWGNPVCVGDSRLLAAAGAPRPQDRHHDAGARHRYGLEPARHRERARSRQASRRPGRGRRRHRLRRHPPDHA